MKPLLSDLRVWIALALVAWIVLAATALGGDANWDLRNYHLYGPFALFHHEAARDIAPAQVQTYHPPMLDVPYYLLVRHIRSVALLNAVLAIPHALVAVLAFLITVQVLRPDDLPGSALAAIATVIGMTGTATLPTLATTMDESVPAALVLTALLLLTSAGPWTRRRLLAAGLLCGAAAGLKLTTMCAGAGLGVALMVTGGGTLSARAHRGLVFGMGAVIGAVALAGWWWWRLYAQTGNPVFPYFNGLFRSPLVALVTVSDTRFMPKDLAQWLGYPFHWATRAFRGPAELPIRDPRFALATLATLALAVQTFRTRDRTAGLLVVFLAAGYVIWLRQFAILRYLSCLEPLTGTVMLAALRPVLRTYRVRLAAACLSAAALAGLLSFTRYPDWERTPRCKRVATCPPPIDVSLPPIAEDSLVLLLDPGPMSYLRIFAPRSARFVSAHNNLIHLNRAEPMQHWVQEALDTQAGEIWGLEEVEGSEGIADLTLAFYGLRRESCLRVSSNLDHGRIRICLLSRLPSGPAPG